MKTGFFLLLLISNLVSAAINATVHNLTMLALNVVTIIVSCFVIGCAIERRP